MGLSPQDTVDIDANVYPESKKQKKLIEKLQTDNMNIQEEKVKLKLENKRLKKQVSIMKKPIHTFSTLKSTSDEKISSHHATISSYK